MKIKTKYFKIIFSELGKILSNIFDIEELHGELMMPTEYEVKLKEWLNNDDELFSQIRNQVIMKHQVDYILIV
jgi:hypothetical protein